MWRLAGVLKGFRDLTPANAVARNARDAPPPLYFLQLRLRPYVIGIPAEVLSVLVDESEVLMLTSTML
jgi:hypothetical protein